MKRPVIFDIDGVLADWVLGFTTLAYINGLIAESRILKTIDNTRWDGLGGIPKLIQRSTWEIAKASSDFWRDLQPMIDDKTALRIVELHDSRDVYFVTNRMGIDAKVQTEEWLSSVLNLDNPTVIISKRKGEIAKAVDAEFCIEDKAANASCVAWMTDDRCKSFLVDRPYNRCDSGFLASSVKRIETVGDYLDHIQVG